MASADIISFDAAVHWTEDLTFVLRHQAAHGFQVQLTKPNGSRIALDYRVSSDGSISESSTAGGIDYYALPARTRATLFVEINYEASAIAAVLAYTARRGWGTGTAVEGDAVRDRAYSKDGYGVIRGRIGDWP
jgi:hypothetical protein